MIKYSNKTKKPNQAVLPVELETQRRPTSLERRPSWYYVFLIWFVSIFLMGLIKGFAVPRIIHEKNVRNLWFQISQSVSSNANWSSIIFDLQSCPGNQQHSLWFTIDNILHNSQYSLTWNFYLRSTILFSPGWQKLTVFQRGQKCPKLSSGTYLLFLWQLRRLCTQLQICKFNSV